MSPLTKVFAILVALLSVSLVALVVPFVANTEDFRGQISELKNELAVAKAAAELKHGDMAATLSAENERRAGVEKENLELTSRVSELQAELASVQAKYNDAVRSTTQLEASVQTLSNAYKLNVKLLDTAQSQLKIAQEKNVDQGKQVIELTDTVFEKDNTLERLAREVRRYKERVQGYEEQIATYEQVWEQVPDDVKVAIAGEALELSDVEVAVQTPETPIEGRVVRVDETAGGLTLVEINVGEKDRVASGMKFIISRNNEYLGDLEIGLVDVSQSVGRVKLAQGAIQAGDRVFAGKF